MVGIISSSITQQALYGKMLLLAYASSRWIYLADNLQSVIDYFGGSVPFDRAERWTILQEWENEGIVRFSRWKKMM